MNRKSKSIIYLIILIVLIILTVIALSVNRNSTLSAKNTQFSFADTQHITKIFMADMLGKSVILERTSQGWLVNSKYDANMDRIDLLLETIASIRVKNPVPLSMHNFIIRNMASNSVKVEIYTKRKKPVKVYYVGGPTPDYLGTYMLLESRNKEPYVVYKPGLNGYLSEGYYFTDETEWRTKVVFNADPLEIEQVEVFYTAAPDSSFLLKIKDNQTYLVSNRNGESYSATEINTGKVRRFLTGFSNLQFMEVINTTKNTRLKDSILLSKPFITVKLYEKGKKLQILNLYLKSFDKRSKITEEAAYDNWYFYAHTNSREDQIFLMQDLVLQRILWRINDFRK